MDWDEPNILVLWIYDHTQDEQSDQEGKL